MNDALAPYIPVAVGVTLGAAAYFGNRLTSGESVTWAHGAGFVLQLGLVAAFAAFVIETSGVSSPTGKVVVSGILAVGAQSVIEWARERGWGKVLNVDTQEKSND